MRLGCVDDVVPEPVGGTQADAEQAFAMVNQRLVQHLAELKGVPLETLLNNRYEKFRNIAQFYSVAPVQV